jgi:hypothetical protein
VASWLNTETWPIWAWVASFWLVVLLAAYGSLLVRRSKRFQWPLVAPAAIALVVVTITAGDPRYHAPADLGFVVLAAVALDRLTRRHGGGTRPLLDPVAAVTAQLPREPVSAERG